MTYVDIRRIAVRDGYIVTANLDGSVGPNARILACVDAADVRGANARAFCRWVNHLLATALDERDGDPCFTRWTDSHGVTHTATTPRGELNKHVRLVIEVNGAAERVGPKRPPPAAQEAEA